MDSSEFALSQLASRLGYAVRKAWPCLSECERIRLLSPITDVLDDLAVSLCPVAKDGSFTVCKRPGVKKQLCLLSALAVRQEADFSDALCSAVARSLIADADETPFRQVPPHSASRMERHFVQAPRADVDPSVHATADVPAAAVYATAEAPEQFVDVLFIDVPVPMTQEEVVHVPKVVQEVDVPVIDAPVPMTQEEAVHVPKVVQEEHAHNVGFGRGVDNRVPSSALAVAAPAATASTAVPAPTALVSMVPAPVVSQVAVAVVNGVPPMTQDNLHSYHKLKAALNAHEAAVAAGQDKQASILERHIERLRDRLMSTLPQSVEP